MNSKQNFQESNLMAARITRVDKESCLANFITTAPKADPASELDMSAPLDLDTESVIVETDAVRWSGQAPVVGDVIILEPPDVELGIGATLIKILPRRTALYRKDPGQLAKEQAIAANMDIVALVHGLDQKLNIAKLERGLVLIAESGAEAQIILAKADLVAQEVIDPCLQSIEALLPQNPVIITSARTGQGMDELGKLLCNHKTLVLLGSSGAGKSSLINGLLTNVTQKVAEVRQTDARGRHATVARSLIPIPTGGYIIDTPGVRAMGLGDIDIGLDEVFSEIAELAKKCKFRDCGHKEEPECAVKQAAVMGDLAKERLERYLQLKAEIAQVLKDKENQERKKRH